MNIPAMRRKENYSETKNDLLLIETEKYKMNCRHR